MKIANVLVPVSGSAADEETIGLACRVARSAKGKVHAVYVIEVKRSLPLDADIAPEVHKGEMVLDRAELVAEEMGCEIDTELLQAREAGPAIIDEAMERNVDLIILGIDYKKRFGEFNLGKTTPYVLKHAPCRVWVCREPIAQWH